MSRTSLVCLVVMAFAGRPLGAAPVTVEQCLTGARQAALDVDAVQLGRDGVLGRFADLMAGLALGEDFFARRRIAGREGRARQSGESDSRHERHQGN